MVEVPTMTIPSGARETGVPDIVIAGLPGVSVVPAATILLTSTLNVSLPMVKDEIVGTNRSVGLI